MDSFYLAFCMITIWVSDSVSCLIYQKSLYHSFTSYFSLLISILHIFPEWSFKSRIILFKILYYALFPPRWKSSPIGMCSVLYNSIFAFLFSHITYCSTFTIYYLFTLKSHCSFISYSPFSYSSWVTHKVPSLPRLLNLSNLR